jgi:hypothetical protein
MSDQLNQATSAGLVSFTFSTLRSAIINHLKGDFRLSTQLAVSMMLDSRYSSCINKRVNFVVQSPMKVTPEDPNSEADREASAWVEKNLSKMLPLTELQDWMKTYHHLGYSPAWLDWHISNTESVPVLNTVNTEFVYRDYSRTKGFKLSSMDGELDIVEGDGTWAVLNSFKDGKPNGFVCDLSTQCANKQILEQAALEWANTRAEPILLAITPDNVGEEERIQFVNNVNLARSTKTVECQRNESGMGYDVEALSVPVTSWELMTEYKGDSNTEITIRVLGVNLTTEVQGGSYAAAVTQYGNQQELISADANILRDVIREQILRPAIIQNFGPNVGIPWIEFLTTEGALNAEKERKRAEAERAEMRNVAVAAAQEDAAQNGDNNSTQ